MKKTVSLIIALILALSVACVPAYADSNTGSTYTGSCSSNELHNIDLVISELDGWTISKGATFSFNAAVGPRTSERGYRIALNGRGVKVTGGGVAQVATTVFLAVRGLNDVKIGHYLTYGKNYCRDYVADGAYAIVTDYNAGNDFTFTPKSSSVTLHLYRSGTRLYCEATTGGGSSGTVVATSSIAINGSSGTKSNINRALNAVGTFTLKPGQFFSFNDRVGPRTSANGYTTGLNGRGVKVSGGGVAQVASLIWLCVKKTPGITVVEKSTYGDRYNQSYVYYKEDAIVTDYAAGRDFSFRNNGLYTLTFRLYAYNGVMYCEVTR